MEKRIIRIRERARICRRYYIVFSFILSVQKKKNKNEKTTLYSNNIIFRTRKWYIYNIYIIKVSVGRARPSAACIFTQIFTNIVIHTYCSRGRRGTNILLRYTRRGPSPGTHVSYASKYICARVTGPIFNSIYNIYYSCTEYTSCYYHAGYIGI